MTENLLLLSSTTVQALLGLGRQRSLLPRGPLDVCTFGRTRHAQNTVDSIFRGEKTSDLSPSAIVARPPTLHLTVLHVGDGGGVPEDEHCRSIRGPGSIVLCTVYCVLCTVYGGVVWIEVA